MQEMRFLSLPHLENLRIGVKRIARGENYERNFHDHNFSEIVLVLESANVIHWANGRSCPLVRGDLLVLHPGLQHGYANTGSLAIINLIYDAKKLPLPLLDGNMLPLLKRFLSPQNGPCPEKPIARLSEEMIESVNRLIVRLEKELSGKEPGQHLCSFGLFVSILVLLARSGGDRMSAADMTGSTLPALHYINLHFREELDLDHLTRLCFLSRRSFFRRFRELTGVTPLEYQRQKRLELAENMLRTSNLSLNMIAEQCGFCDTNHLIKLFSARYGTSPGKFRRSQSEQGCPPAPPEQMKI